MQRRRQRTQHPASFDQIQRLGNPLISEVLSVKRSHPTHGSIGPADDVAWSARRASASSPGRAAWPAGRPSTPTRSGSVLLPDVLMVQTDKDPPEPQAGSPGFPLPRSRTGTAAGSWTDDVVDLALLAVFGDPFGADPDGAAGKEALTTDNVASDSPISGTFPYLGAPN